MKGNVLAIGTDPEVVERQALFGLFACSVFLIAAATLSIWATDPRDTPIEWSASFPLLLLVLAAGLGSWLAARTLMRWHRCTSLRLLVTRGVPERLTMTHHIAEDGVTTTSEGRALHQPWSSFVGTAETERLLVLRSSAGREPVILTKETLGADEKATVLRWMEERAGRPHGSAPQEPTAGEGWERLEYFVTADDHTEEVLHNLETAYTPLAWFRSSVLPWLILCLVVPAGPLLLWFVDLRRPHLDEALSAFAQTFPLGGWLWLTVTAFVVIGLQLARPTMLRVHARSFQQTVYDGSGKHGPMVLTFDDKGLRIAQDGYRDDIARGIIVRIEERPNHLVAILAGGAHYAIPKRAFAPGQEAAFRALGDGRTRPAR